MKKTNVWFVISGVSMLVILILYKNDLAANLIFCKKNSHNIWINSITTQFVHFSIVHYLCNLIFMIIIWGRLKEKFTLKQIILTGLFSMLVVACALLIFAKREVTYCGYSGIALGWYALWGMEKFSEKQDRAEKVERMIKGIIFISISLFAPMVSSLMHISGLMAGVLCFGIIRYSRKQ